MLTDREIARLRADPRYAKAVRMGLDVIVDRVIESREDDLKPTVSNLLKLISKLWRARTIRSELQCCSCAFLERLINTDLNWPRSPGEIKLLCDSHEAGYSWMRYDEPRTTALFRRAYGLLTDAAFRDLLKSHSALAEPRKNEALVKLRIETQTLEANVVRSIRSRGIFDKLTDLNADEFYRAHEEEIQRRFLEGSQGGALGLPGDVGH